MSQSEPHVEALPRAQRQSGGNVLEKRTRLFSARYGHRKQRRDWILSCSERASADTAPQEKQDRELGCETDIYWKATGSAGEEELL